MIPSLLATKTIRLGQGIMTRDRYPLLPMDLTQVSRARKPPHRRHPLQRLLQFEAGPVAAFNILLDDCYIFFPFLIVILSVWALPSLQPDPRCITTHSLFPFSLSFQSFSLLQVSVISRRQDSPTAALGVAPEASTC